MTRKSCVPPVSLARLNFPPYVAAVLSEGHLLVAGGGGASKTGIANKLEIFEISRTSGRANLISSVDTKSTALMNGTVFQFDDQTYFAAGGIGGICQIFSTELSVDCDIRMNGIHKNGTPVGPEPHASSMHLRRRNSSSSSRDSVSNGHVPTATTVRPPADDECRLTYNVQPFESFKCDFHETVDPNNGGKVDESFLKAVKFCAKSNVLVTGGADGHVRFWQFPTLTQSIDIHAHAAEIVDLDVDAVGESLVTIARDGRCCLWRMRDGSKISDLEYVIPVAKSAMRPVKYKFKGCRFLPAPEAPQVLFTTLVPATRTKPPEPCYLCRWDVRQCLIDRRVVVGTEHSAHMSISPDGGCLALGTLAGAVSVYGTASMTKLYQVDNCHRNFVTRVEFLTTCLEDEREAKTSEHLVSISVDNQICLHTINLNESIDILESPVIFVVTLIFIYFMCILFGL